MHGRTERLLAAAARPCLHVTACRLLGGVLSNEKRSSGGGQGRPAQEGVVNEHYCLNRCGVYYGAPWEPDFLPSCDDDDTPVRKSCGAEGLLVTVLVPFPVPASGGRG
jgi:hypothetical protein